MSLVNYIYANNGTMYQPLANCNQLGGQPLLWNNSQSAVTSGAFPLMQARKVYENIIISATAWNSATVNIQVSLDGVNNWFSLSSFNGVSLAAIAADTLTTFKAAGVFIRAVVTGTPTGLSVVLS
jgi:hypothetical protein